MAVDAVREWLVDMSRLVGPRKSETGDLMVVIARMAAMFEAKSPPDLFTEESLEFCLRTFQFFPTYAELFKRLQVFQRERSKAIAGPAPTLPYADDPSLSDTDRLQIKFWHAKLGHWEYGRMAHTVSWMHRIFPAVNVVLYRDDHLWREIADQREWRPETERPRIEAERARDANDRANIQRWVNKLQDWPIGWYRLLIRHYYTGWLGKYGPHNIEFLNEIDPPDAYNVASTLQPEYMGWEDGETKRLRAKRERAFEAKYGRKIGSLSPENLATARAKAGSPLVTPTQKPQPVDDWGSQYL